MPKVDVAFSFNGSIQLHVSEEVLQDPVAFEQAVLDEIKAANVKLEDLTFDPFDVTEIEEDDNES
mgnify:CR=1 FL=1